MKGKIPKCDNFAPALVLPLHPERLSLKYAFQYPNTSADYIRLLQMKSPAVAKIKCHFKKFDDVFKTVGVQFFYKDEPDPVSFGTTDSDMFHAAEFLTGQEIRKVRVSEQFTVAEGDFRKVSFWDRQGKELAKR